MIRFMTPGLIGERELMAMGQAQAYCRRNHTTELPPDLAKELRILGIVTAPPWPDPLPAGGQRVPFAGTVA